MCLTLSYKMSYNTFKGLQMNYFTSDVHFSDWDTMLHDDRPFKSTKQYDKYIIKTWNKMMTKKDTLYVIGDLFDCNNSQSVVWKDALDYIKKVKVNVVLIMGNNEDRIMKHYFDNSFTKFKDFCLSVGFKDVKKNAYLSFGGYKFYLTHMPINYKQNYVNLVGHLHRSRGMWYSFGLNVSVDLNHYRPLSEKDILFQLSEKAKYYGIDKNFDVL